MVGRIGRGASGGRQRSAPDPADDFAGRRPRRKRADHRRERTDRDRTMTTPPSQMPDGLELARTTPEFTAESVPPALLATHTVAAGVWGRIRVRAG
ncbi:MAG: DUF1971 domain-containing protein, partial [Acidimicrobiales bacterium]|nr:DUF1971 domain-containing protein [Acidimicrobiales bacterium]